MVLQVNLFKNQTNSKTFEFSRQNKKTKELVWVFPQLFCSNHEKNRREFWIVWNIGSVNFEKNQFLKMIYLYRPSDLAQTPGVTPPTPDEVRSFFY